MKKELSVEHIRHSLSHILATAVLKKFPKAKLGIGPVIENGFYYDFLLPRPLVPEDLKELEISMREIIKQGLSFKGKKITPAEGRKIFKDQPFKLELIEDLKKEKKPLSVYATGTVFADLCKGGHVKNTKEINPEAFTLAKIAGAYWKGNEKNKQLTRIYGYAFETKHELEKHITLLEEARLRDHRKLGAELDLFHIDDQVGSGLPLWHPKGALLWRIIEDFWYKEHLKNGYNLVRSPHIGNKSLWEISGHWNSYSESMYPPLEVGQTLEALKNKEKVKESEQYLLKPMNCPFHVQIYKNRPRSYRELPFRWAECGTVYRFEKKGELSGLTRVRGFTQDDAHIFAAKDQVEEELKRVIDFILFIYQSFGFKLSDVKVYLSLRDPKNKKKYVGSDAGWKFSESVLKKIAIEKKLDFTTELGEAAFYGPKLDFKIKDALGREWQCSTLQFDFNLPERFKLSFINTKGKEEQPYILHRALFGSYERFIGLLIEHYAGAFPLWLAPTQIAILPIGESHAGYAKKIAERLQVAEFRVETNDTNETLGKRIRETEMKKIPYIIVVGNEEMNTETISIRKKGIKESKIMSVEQYIEVLKEELKK